MDEFSPLDRIPMSHDETTKIEPTLIIKDAPPIASEQGDLVGPFKPESTAAEAKIEAPVAAAGRGRAIRPAVPKLREAGCTQTATPGTPPATQWTGGWP